MCYRAVAKMLNLVVGIAGVLACPALQADTLGIVASGQGAAYDEFVEAVRNELGRTPGLKIQLLGQGGEAGSARLPEDTVMVVTVGVQATRQFAAQGEGRWPVLAVMVPRASFEALSPAVRHPRRFSAVFMDQPPQRQVELIRTILPAARTVGLIVGPTTQRDFETFRTLAGNRGLSVVAESAARDTELYPALQSVLRSCDVLLALPDPYIVNVSTAQNLLLTSFRFRVPVIGYSAAYVRAGALAAVYSTPRQMGGEAAQIARQVWRGTALPAARYPRQFSVVINRQLAESLGINPPEEAAALQRLQSLESAE